MSLEASNLGNSVRLKQFVKFCIVGGSGVVVDMGMLHLLARQMQWNLSLSKSCSAETAMLTNFVLNEVWTFRGFAINLGRRSGVLLRMVKFQTICGVGIGFAVALLNLFYSRLGLNLSASNLLAIMLVTLWNFWMNALFNWGVAAKQQPVAASSK
ncbi:MAG TPA: GtrA family protein [Verrucomicrobiae bacterium]|nr:GtrA family protein [Verrucomicrobiae bacterium]